MNSFSRKLAFVRRAAPTTRLTPFSFFFFLNDPAPPEIYPLPHHDALPIPPAAATETTPPSRCRTPPRPRRARHPRRDRKSTRLNSSHLVISYAVFCLKKKNSKCN